MRRRALPAGKTLGQFHGVTLECGLQLPQDRLAFLERSAQQRVSVDVQEVEHHETEIAWKLSIPGSQPLLEDFEVWTSLIVDRDDLAV